MADKTPKELMGILLVVFIFLFGFGGYYVQFTSFNNVNNTELSSINKSQEIFNTIESQYQEINKTMEKNPKSGDLWGLVQETPSILSTTGAVIGYMFLSIPTWFMAVFNDMSNSIGIVPTWLIAIGGFFVMLELISWFIYFWTNRRS